MGTHHKQLTSRGMLATEICRADLRLQMAGLGEFVNRRMKSIDASTAKLAERPTESDVLCIRGAYYQADSQGSIVLETPSRPQVPLDLEKPVIQELRRIMQLDYMWDEFVAQTIVDCMLNEPLAMITAVAKASPEMLGPLAQVMADTCRQLGFEPEWKPALEDEDSDAPPDSSQPDEPKR